ncbi:hypothetical protein XA68_13980 [Ophiocordyceps unilateralis]|uniref:SET domain-containing protein n=1 Tax=Ophiocordyceps unilateralis TaxID=268505 RepID=A0A2A9PBE7_OPHUN|nr:hypothetical protein XA68_13980 [Ophiocordyceps unilateralis]
MASLSTLVSVVFFFVARSFGCLESQFGDLCTSSPLRRGWAQLDGILQRPLSSGALQSPLNEDPIPAASPSSPWSYTGDCAQELGDESPTCVYANRSFANGRGISIITTPERAAYIAKTPAFLDSSILSHVNDYSSPPYEERELPGRGRGLIANKTLRRGDVIFSSTPILILDSDSFEFEQDSVQEGQRYAAVVNLPSKTEMLFWGLYGQLWQDPITDRVNTNSFAADIDDENFSVVFPEIAVCCTSLTRDTRLLTKRQRLNHDCRPNAEYYFNSRTLTQDVVASTTIHPGTEITISYIDVSQPRDKRVSQLANWGINCSCHACTRSATLTAASDARLAQISELDRNLSREIARPELPEKLLSLYKEEGLFGFLGAAYRFAALSYCAEGQRSQAVKYAQMAFDSALSDNALNLDQALHMKRLAQRPEEQMCWQFRQRFE